MHHVRNSLRIVCFLIFGLAANAMAEPHILFLVRHAERADAGGTPQKNPALSEKGQKRAEALTRALRDTGITALYTTEFKRTEETAAPLSRSLGIKPEIVPARETATLLGKLKDSSGNVLVVAHSNTLPEIMQGLGISSPPKIGETDYDDLFIVIPGASPRLLHLHYR